MLIQIQIILEILSKPFLTTTQGSPRPTNYFLWSSRHKILHQLYHQNMVYLTVARPQHSSFYLWAFLHFAYYPLSMISNHYSWARMWAQPQYVAHSRCSVNICWRALLTLCYTLSQALPLCYLLEPFHKHYEETKSLGGYLPKATHTQPPVQWLQFYSFLDYGSNPISSLLSQQSFLLSLNF